MWQTCAGTPQNTAENMADVVTVTLNPAIDISSSVDQVVPIRKLRCKPERREAGGGGINVARVARRLGVDVAAIYPAGGSTGILLRHLLEAEGVASLAVDSAGDTREDFTILDESTGEQFRFVFPGPQLDAAVLARVTDLVGSLAPVPQYLVASGSLPRGAPEGSLADLARLAKRRGCRMVLDASGPALRQALEAGVYLVKPNLRELSELVGRRLDTEREWQDAAAVLVESGKAEVVALTLGHLGALLATRRGVLRLPAIAIKMASAVGAGDSFLGGIMAALVHGRGMTEAFRYGLAAASAAVQQPGTALCTREDVARLVERVAPLDQTLAG